MNKFKKAICIGIISTFVFALATGCSSNSEKPTASPSSSEATDDANETKGANVSDAPESSDSTSSTEDNNSNPEENKEVFSTDLILATSDNYKINFIDYLFFFQSNRQNIENSALSSGGYTVENLAEIWKEPAGADSEGNEGTMLDLLRDRSLEDAKQITILYDAAVKEGVTASEADITDISNAVDSMLRQLSAPPNTENIENVEITSEGETALVNLFRLSSAQMREIYTRHITINNYLTVLSDNTTVSEAEMKKEYETNINEYETVTVRHALIESNAKMSEEDQAAAKIKADEIYKLLEDGADIGELAEEHSSDPDSNTNNGEYVFARGEMVAEFEDWSFAAKIDDIGIVQTTYGYHIIKLISTQGYEDVKENVNYNVITDKVAVIIDSLVYDESIVWKIDEEVQNKASI